MFNVKIREIEGKERVIFEGTCSSLKQINYVLRSLAKKLWSWSMHESTN